MFSPCTHFFTERATSEQKGEGGISGFTWPKSGNITCAVLAPRTNLQTRSSIIWPRTSNGSLLLDRDIQEQGGRRRNLGGFGNKAMCHTLTTCGVSSPRKSRTTNYNEARQKRFNEDRYMSCRTEPLVETLEKMKDNLPINLVDHRNGSVGRKKKRVGIGGKTWPRRSPQ